MGNAPKTGDSMKHWFWYVAREDEIMLDVDGVAYGGSILGASRVRLEAAMKAGLLKIKDAYIYRSATRGHYHIVLQLDAPMPAYQRCAWEMQLRSDIYRGRCNLMRLALGVRSPSLLIAPKRWAAFYREPDESCTCADKHDMTVMAECPAALALRGAAAKDSYFGELASHRKVAKLLCAEGRLDVAAFARSVGDDGQ